MSDFLTGRPLDPYYRALAPRPDAEYGSILPFACNAPGSPTWVLEGRDFRPAMPGFARSVMKGFLDLLQGTETGRLTPEALETITLGSLGAGGVLAPRGALAAGGARRGLSRRSSLPDDWWKDRKAQLSRATEMKFHPELRLYHGADGADFAAFAYGSGRSTSPGSPWPGVWAAENPEFANLFPIREGDRRINHRMLPLMARWNWLGKVEDAGGLTDRDIYFTIRNAWADCYDAIRFRNYNTFPDGTPTPTWIFRDPNQLRSPFAKFDPARRDSSDLMAGFAAPGPAPVPGLDAWRPPEPAPPGMIRLPTGQVVDEAAIPNHLRPSGRQVY